MPFKNFVNFIMHKSLGLFETMDALSSELSENVKSNHMSRGSERPTFTAIVYAGLICTKVQDLLAAKDLESQTGLSICFHFC